MCIPIYEYFIDKLEYFSHFSIKLHKQRVKCDYQRYCQVSYYLTQMKKKNYSTDPNDHKEFYEWQKKKKNLGNSLNNSCLTYYGYSIDYKDMMTSGFSLDMNCWIKHLELAILAMTGPHFSLWQYIILSLVN